MESAHQDRKTNMCVCVFMFILHCVDQMSPQV